MARQHHHFTAAQIANMARLWRQHGMDDMHILSNLAGLASESLDDLHHRVQARVEINRQVRERTENGLVAVIESGRDCDQCEYEGYIHMFPATPACRFWEAVDEMYAQAEGPISWYVERPSVASATIVARSYDLALAAFENGMGSRHVIPGRHT